MKIINGLIIRTSDDKNEVTEETKKTQKIKSHNQS